MAARKTRWSAHTLLDHQRLVDPVAGKRLVVVRRGRRSYPPGVPVSALARPLREIDADFVRKWLNGEVHGTTVAMNAFVRLRAFLNCGAMRAEYKTEVSPSACASCVAKDELPKPTAKSDCLQREQLAPWFKQVREIQNPVASAYLQAFLLLTGARREEMAGLRWGDVDFKWGRRFCRTRWKPTARSR